MERVQESSKKMVWVDGNTLVKAVGEQEANEYLHGTGYQSKLTEFIKNRDLRLREEEALLKARKKQVKPTQEFEPEA